MRVYRIVCPNGTVAEDDLRWVRAAVDRARYWDKNHDHGNLSQAGAIHHVEVADWVTLP